MSTSDSLPFTQADRAMKAKAAQLASAIGVSYQHALGSLLEFWDGCGDPRELERLLSLGQEAVVLEADEVVLRFKLASGKEVEPRLMAAAGFLESVGGESFRVRGMSRFFEPIKRRLQARDAASKGGKATAAKLTRVDGKFTAETAEPLAGLPLGEPLKRATKRQPSDAPSEQPSGNQPTHQAANQVRGQSTEYISKEDLSPSTSSPFEAIPPPRKKPKPPRPADEPETDATWQPLVNALTEAFTEARNAKPAWSGRDFVALKRLRKLGSDDEIRARWARGLVGTYAREVHTVAQLEAKWNALATDEPRGKTLPPARAEDYRAEFEALARLTPEQREVEAMRGLE